MPRDGPRPSDEHPPRPHRAHGGSTLGAVAYGVVVVALLVLTVAAPTGRDDAATGTATSPAPATGPPPGGEGEPAPADASTEPGAPEPLGEPPPPSDDPDPSEAAVEASPVAALDGYATGLAVHPDSGDLYLTEQTGVVRLLRRTQEDDGRTVPQLVETPALDLTDQVGTGAEQGLLGIAIDPEGEHAYLTHNRAEGDEAVLLVEYAFSGEVLDPDSRREVLAVEKPFEPHNAGQVGFDADGTLWMSTGDGGFLEPADAEEYVEIAESQLASWMQAQDADTLLGKLLRIDPHADADGDQPYTIPEDNPFAAGGGRPEVWALGFRNPWRFAIDAETGDVWVPDVSGYGTEEINLLPAEDDRLPGANLGWPVQEGTELLPGRQPLDDEQTDPVHTYTGEDGERCAVIGGQVYRGSWLPELTGAFLFTDLCDGRLRALVAVGGGYEEVVVPGVRFDQPITIGQGPSGELYVGTAAGEVLRLDPAS